MKIKMLRSVPGSVNGIDVELFKTGIVYDVDRLGEELVSTFLDNGFAEIHKEGTTPLIVTTKAVKGAPENKMVDPVVEDKESEDEDKESEDEDKESEIKPRKKLKLKKKESE